METVGGRILYLSNRKKKELNIKRKESLPDKSRNVVCLAEIRKGYTKCFLARFQSSSNVTDFVRSKARGDR